MLVQYIEVENLGGYYEEEVFQQVDVVSLGFIIDSINVFRH